MNTLTQSAAQSDVVLQTEGSHTASAPADVPTLLTCLLHGLDTLSHGVALFDACGGLRYANAAARMSLARIGWQFSGEEIHPRQPAHLASWLQALQRACARGQRELLSLPGTRKSGFAACIPVATLGERLAFVTFSREELCGAIELQMFASRYELTGAESQVLRQLCKGMQAAQIANEHGVSTTTVRTQISAIRTKTASCSVRQLLDSLSRMPPMNPLSTVSFPNTRVSGPRC